MNVTTNDINSFVDTVETIKTECEEYLNECMEYHRQSSDFKDECETYKDNSSDFNDTIDAMHLEIAAYFRDITNINNCVDDLFDTIKQIEGVTRQHKADIKLKYFWANCFIAVAIFVMTINIILMVTV